MPKADAPVDLALDGEGPRYEQIRRAVASKIAAGEWRPGERVPAETQLMAALDASRMTVHRALSALAREGLIERRRRAGSVVARPRSPHAVLEVPDVGDEVRCRGAVYTFRILRRRVISRARAEARVALDLTEGDAVLDVRCLHCADGRPFVLEERLVNLACVPAARHESFAEMPPGTWLLARVPWSSAEHLISAVPADAEESRLLEVEIGAALLVVERRTWTGPIVVTRARFAYPGMAHRFVARFEAVSPSRVG